MAPAVPATGPRCNEAGPGGWVGEPGESQAESESDTAGETHPGRQVAMPAGGVCKKTDLTPKAKDFEEGFRSLFAR